MATSAWPLQDKTIVYVNKNHYYVGDVSLVVEIEDIKGDNIESRLFTKKLDSVPVGTDLDWFNPDHSRLPHCKEKLPYSLIRLISLFSDNVTFRKNVPVIYSIAKNMFVDGINVDDREQECGFDFYKACILLKILSKNFMLDEEPVFRWSEEHKCFSIKASLFNTHSQQGPSESGTGPDYNLYVAMAASYYHL